MNANVSLVPPIASDSTPITYGRAAAAMNGVAGTKGARPIVVLARDRKFFPAPHESLVVAVMLFGSPSCPGGGGPTGGTGPAGPSTYESNVVLLDAKTGALSECHSFPGPLPQISASHATG